MGELYRYYRKRLLDEWQSLSMETEVKSVFEEKYLGAVLCQIRQLEKENEKLQTLVRETEKLIKMSEEQRI